MRADTLLLTQVWKRELLLIIKLQYYTCRDRPTGVTFSLVLSLSLVRTISASFIGARGTIISLFDYAFIAE